MMTDDIYIMSELQITSSYLVMLMNKFSIEELRKMYDYKSNSFKFMSTFDGDNVKYILEEDGILNVSIDVEKMVDVKTNLTDLLYEIKEKIIDRHVILNNEDYVNNLEEKVYNINHQRLIALSVAKFKQYITMVEQVATMLFLNHGENYLFDDLILSQSNIFNSTPLIEIGNDMMDKKTILKTLEKTNEKLDRYQNNPNLVAKYKAHKENLEKELQNHETK